MNPIFADEARLRGVTFRPALLCAPMAGITHCAFRRVVSGMGGCGGFFTEMLSAGEVLKEDVHTSPWLRRSPSESRVIYQLMVRRPDRLDRVVDRLRGAHPDGIDINLACHAPGIRYSEAGSRLFDNAKMLADVLRAMRACWDGLLTVKIRLGSERPGWEGLFAERLRIVEGEGVDAVILHPRFFEDKLKRRARHDLLPWAASLTRLPLIANGDIAGPADIESKRDALSVAVAVMIGRKAAASPWVFQTWGRTDAIDRRAVWMDLLDAITDDFDPATALTRMRILSKYYARNFLFGHAFETAIRNAEGIEQVRERSEKFFASPPEVLPEPFLLGI